MGDAEPRYIMPLLIGRCYEDCRWDEGTCVFLDWSEAFSIYVFLHDQRFRLIS